MCDFIITGEHSNSSIHVHRIWHVDAASQETVCRGRCEGAPRGRAGWRAARTAGGCAADHDAEHWWCAAERSCPLRLVILYLGNSFFKHGGRKRNDMVCVLSRPDSRFQKIKSFNLFRFLQELMIVKIYHQFKRDLLRTGKKPVIFFSSTFIAWAIYKFNIN